MKTKLLIIIGIVIVALGFVFTFMIIDMFQSQLKEHEKIDELTYMLSDEPLQRVLNHCEFQRKLATGEIPERNADGSYNGINSIGLYYTNGTHYIDNNICEWREIENEK